MIKRLAYILLLLFACQANAQYYLRGEIRDEKNQPLPNVRIILLSSHYTYASGIGGSFGITSNSLIDSLQLSLEGYESRTVKVRCDQWQQITMNVLSSTANRNRPKLISVTKDYNRTSKLRWLVSDETYFQLVENENVDADKYPNTGFSLNVNKASYSNVRRFLNNQSSVPPDAVRTEELINYFNLHYREPEPGNIFRMETQLSDCPWNNQRRLLFLNVNARKLDLANVPPGNFVFLIDVSGSMDMPNRLPLLKAAFQMLVKNLRPIDTVSIVTYGGGVSIWMQPTGGNEKEKILKSIEELQASGDTPGEAAIMTAYKLAERTFMKNGNNRVILATDGDFNVGQNSEKALEELISREKQTGVYLTCLGVGMGNFKDSKLQALAKRGNGNFAYLDDINEAEKVLVTELTQTFYAVADDVFMNIRFNPAQVKSYRLVGFDNRRDAAADNNLDLEGGEIGSGNSILAVFEIETDSLRSNKAGADTSLAYLDLQYSLCNDTFHKELIKTCPDNYVSFGELDKDYRFASAVMMFSLKLKDSKYIKSISWEDIEMLTASSYDAANYLQAEFLGLVQKARKLYTNNRKKRKKDDD